MVGDSPGWQIVAWSRETARGVLSSEVGELPFDGHHADVDDFIVGEAVEVTLEGEPGQWTVARVSPVRPPPPWIPERAPLPPGWDEAIRKLNELLGRGSLTAMEWLDASCDGLRLKVGHLEWPGSKPYGIVVFRGVTYVQLATRATALGRVSAWLWESVRVHRRDLLRGLSIDADDLDPTSVLVCFERADGGTPGFVVTDWLEVIAEPDVALPHPTP